MKITKKRIIEEKKFAKFIAMFVRNNMEDFHVKHLTDKQMKELNPLIRNAIYTALYVNDLKMKAMARKKETEIGVRARTCSAWAAMMIPDYWEEPELMKSEEGYLNNVPKNTMSKNPNPKKVRPEANPDLLK